MDPSTSIRPMQTGEHDHWLEQPWILSFITSTAPYTPAIGQLESADLLQKRIHRVLEIANTYGHSSSVLGAWATVLLRKILGELLSILGMLWKTT